MHLLGNESSGWGVPLHQTHILSLCVLFLELSLVLHHARTPSEKYEATKKRKGAIEALKAIAPDNVDPGELKVDELEAALKEAKDVGAGMFEVPDDTAFGERAIKHAEWKLQVARHVHAGGLASDMEEKQTVTGKEDDGLPDPERKEMQEEVAAARAAGEDLQVRALGRAPWSPCHNVLCWAAGPHARDVHPRADRLFQDIQETEGRVGTNQRPGTSALHDM